MIEFLMWAGGIIVTGIFTLIGFIMRMIFGKIKDTETNHAVLSARLESHRLHTVETFATKVDVNKGFDRMMEKLDKIDDKLDKKADK